MLRACVRVYVFTLCTFLVVDTIFSNSTVYEMTGSGALRRSSRLAQRVRLQAEVEDTTRRSSQTGTPYLPLEVKGIIAKFLCKSDLKILRCVSKQWHTMATPLLFDQVYVSPRSKDIQIFSHITKHPVLSRSIKRMICDVSIVLDLSHELYFHQLCDQWRSLTAFLGKKYPFNSSHPRLNEFVNAIIRAEESWGNLFSEYAHDEYVIEGWQLSQDLAKEERQAFEHGSEGMYYSDLCSGLHRLPNLQSVMIDNDMWGKVGMHMSYKFYPFYPEHTRTSILSGSPLARSWVPWHLHPQRADDAGFEDLSTVIYALSRTKSTLKHFSCQSLAREGLSPWDFAVYNETDAFAQHMTTALRQLQTLELQITPRRIHAIDNGILDALGFLPQLLEQLANLRYLKLILESAESIQRYRLSVLTPLNDTCYSYSQVFPQHGKWEHLEGLHLSGLAIDGLDLVFLLLHQMPQLKRLWLYRIDLLQGRWSGVIEALRFRAVLRPWELLSLQGSLRHEGGMWWPCAPDLEDKEYLILGDFMRYAKEGGRHPCLPPDVDHRLSVCYYQELFLVAGPERVRAFWHRVQSIEDH